MLGKLILTKHAEYKMKEYGVSLQKVRGVMRNPKRIEKGIKGGTIAAMQPKSVKNVNGKEIWTQELWVMYTVGDQREKKGRESGKNTETVPEKLQRLLQADDDSIRILSVWRYPGVSDARELPEHLIDEMAEIE